MDYTAYLDKVFGCYIGKCVGGTVGAPYEGMKQVLAVTCDKRIFEDMLPNDDLDLQVLWLEGLKRWGEHIHSDHLAALFKTGYPYSPGEYAFFKKNWERGIHPPYSGSFNNQYYHQGMGCPIRAEIWGCVAPLNPTLACRLSELDGRLDHSEESIYGEMFVASLISLSFGEDGLEELLQQALAFTPESRVRQTIVDTMNWCRVLGDITAVRERILGKYGHPDCTNLFQNIGITVAALMIGKLDFMRTIELAVNCGYDTDCTAGLAASVIGAIKGAGYFQQQFGVDDIAFKLDARCEDYNHSIRTLSEEICRVGVHYTNNLNNSLTIDNAPVRALRVENPGFLFDAAYDALTIRPGEKRTVRITVRNTQDRAAAVAFTADYPAGFEGEITEAPSSIEAHAEGRVTLTIGMLHKELLSDTNITVLNLVSEGRQHSYSFGLITPTLYRISRPYNENYFHINPVSHANYYDFFSEVDADKRHDAIRNYHLNTRVDTERAYLDLAKLSMGEEAGLIDTAVAYEDRISISQLVSSSGPCVLYLVREIISDRALTVSLHIGCSDQMEVYFNGAFIVRNEESCWWTGENYHIANVELREGKNLLAVKLARRSEDAVFSCALVHAGELLKFPEHVTGLRQPNRLV
jgi:ADP-ribosylglycohydrolase